MRIFKFKSELQVYLNQLREIQTIGFVPTMGSLHQGHVALIDSAKSYSDIVVCSIFVNPKQFDSSQDFDKYPRSLSQDISLLNNINCDILYCPDESDIYSSSERADEFDLNGLDRYMEGKYRKNHFQGVATVVKKLFQLVAPHFAFFGEKDLQQLQIIKHITRQLDSGIKIMGVPTVRDDSGLAISSRNKRLNALELEKAKLLYQSLLYIRKNFTKKTVILLKEEIELNFRKQSELKLEYLEIVDIQNLQPIDIFLEKDRNAVCIAASISGVRLIDNIIF